MESTENAPQFDLIVRHAGGIHRVPLESRIVIGRGTDADLCIQDPRLSRLHCRFVREGDGVKVTDLGSSNGTRVLGQEISQLRVPLGRCVELSGETAAYLWPSGEAFEFPSDGRDVEPPSAEPATPELAEAEAETAPRVAAAPLSNSRPAAAPERRRPAAAPLAAPAARRAAAPVAPKGPAYGKIAAIAGGVLILVLGIVALSRPNPEAVAQRELQAVEALAERHDYAAAMRAADGLLKLHANTAAGREAKAKITLFEECERKRSEAEARISAAIASLDQTPYAVVLAELDQVASFAVSVMSEAELAAARARAEELADGVAGTVVDTAMRATRDAMSRGDFAHAARVLAEVEASVYLSPKWQPRLVEERRRLEKAAADGLSRALGTAAAEAPAQRLRSYDSLLLRFAGLPEEGRLRAARRLLEQEILAAESLAARAASPASRESAPAPAVALDPRTQEKLSEALTEAEGHAAMRRFDQAMTAFEQAAKVAAADQKAAISARADRMRRAAAVLDALVQKMKSDRRAFAKVPLGAGQLGQVLDADARGVELALGAGGRVKWWWNRLNAERLHELLSRASLRGEGAVDQAILYLEWGDKARALEVLATAHSRETNHRAAVEDLAREARGFATLPPGGFEVFAGRLLTRNEAEEARLAAEIARLQNLAETAPLARLDAVSNDLQALGERGKEALVVALEARLKGLGPRVKELKGLQPARLLALQTALYEELEERRKAALALIFDAKRYPYPYADNQAEVQAEVDGLVQRVRILWETPSAEVAERVEGFGPLLEEGQNLSARLKALGRSDTLHSELIAAFDERLALKNYRGHKDAEKLLDTASKVKAFNDAIGEDVIHTEERSCHEATNRYRVMMGRRPVLISNALVLAARGHSEEMKALGYFAHESPVAGRKSPSDRARLAGYGGGVSENIAAGQPNGVSALRAWIGSSGHHRNVLGERWTELGCGQSPGDTFWTQNFGSQAGLPR